MTGDDNLQRMKTLDDAWNAQDWEVFRKRHSSDTAVHWPGNPNRRSAETLIKPSPRRFLNP